MSYYRGLAVFAAIAILIILAAVFALGLFAEKGFTEKKAESLLKSHYNPLSISDFESETLDDAPVKEASYLFSGEDEIVNGVPVPSYFGFADAVIAYDDFGNVISAHLTIVNRSVPGFAPTRTFACSGKSIEMFTEENADYLALAFSGDKLVEVMTESFIERISKPLSGEDTQVTEEVRIPLEQAIEHANSITGIFMVWYYNPEKKAEYTEKVQSSIEDISGIGCV